MPIFSRMHTNEDGFTLVELLAAMAISLLVLFATLESFDAFSSNAAQQTRVTDANDQVRSAMDRTVGDLRGASAILRASSNDLVYAVPQTSSTTSVKRLCVDGGDGDLYGSSSTVSGTPAAPSAACSTGTRIASLRSAPGTAFTYDGASSSAAPALVKNVGLKFSLDTTARGRPGSSTLEASAARRSAGTLPITDADLDTSCNPSGVPLLSLGAGVPNVAGLTVTYATTGGVTLGVGVGTAAIPITVPAGVTTILATVTDALGVTNTIQKDVSCNT